MKGEICGCDLVAIRDGEPPLLVIVELKLGLSLELLLQAVDRMPVADSVWLAVPRTRRGRDRDRRAHKLCRLSRHRAAHRRPCRRDRGDRGRTHRLPAAGRT